MSRWAAGVDPGWDMAKWRALARHALRAGIPPEAIDWCDGPTVDLLAAPAIATAPADGAVPSVPPAFLDLAGAVLCHRDARRHGLLYRLLWRIAHGERRLLSTPTDADLHRATALSRAVRRDCHKMKAFVRFREVPGCSDRFIAWFEPEHHIVDRVAPFFAKRFTGMQWAILTPERRALWDGATLAFGPGAVRGDAPADDAREALWRVYYENIFNPARLNPQMMCKEMPQKYWANLPETASLPGLLRQAGSRVQTMVDSPPQPCRRRIPQALPNVRVGGDSLTG